MTLIEKQKLTEEYLRQRYIVDVATVDQIASEVGCSVFNVRKRIRDWGLGRGKRALRAAGGAPSWNLGLTKDTDPRLASIAATRVGEGNPMSGRVAWNKGLRPADDERVQRMTEAMRAGFDTPETRAKMSDAKRGKVREQSNRWRGGIDLVGPYSSYRKTVDGRRVYVHRFVAETCLGRHLTRKEHVHHIDRTESNNVPPNLLVLSEGDHATLHGAIYRGECDTRAEQIEWLTRAGIPFLEIT
jgi:hypothetical protein